jgi:hypothetical protein
MVPDPNNPGSLIPLWTAGSHMPEKRLFRPIATALIVGFAPGAPGAAQDDEKEIGWFDTAEFSFFMTSGNAEAESLALDVIEGSSVLVALDDLDTVLTASLVVNF